MSWKNKFKGASVDSLLLTFVKVITALLGLVVTKLIAMNFSLTEYGTYSQSFLVTSTATSITILGMTDAINYFFNNTTDPKKKEIYTNTIFAMQYVVGIVTALVILFLQRPLIAYFENESLLPFIWIVAILPLFNNLIPMAQVLFVSVGKAKIIAIRNLFLSIARVIAVVIACYLSKNILTVVIYSLIADVVQVIYFFATFSKKAFWVNPFKCDLRLIPEILKFCIPMAIYVMCKALLRNIDRYIIDYFMTTDDLAVYTNASKQLPFDLLTVAFFTVLIPIITRYINTKNFTAAQNCFRAYLRLGYLTTWILTGGAIVVAKQLMQLLYAEKYLVGLPVFVVYLFVEIINFANVANVLAGAGKTKTLMLLPIISLPINFIFNIASIKWLNLGMLGPAIVTLLVSILTVFLLLYFSAKELHCKLHNLFNLKEIALVSCEILLTGGACYLLRLWMESLNIPYLIILFVTYGIYAAVMLALNFRKLLACLKEINRMK